MAEYFGADGIGQLLSTNNAYGTGAGTTVPWDKIAAGVAMTLGGLSQERKANSAMGALGQANIDTMGPVGRAQLDELLKMLSGQAGNIQQGFSKGAAQQDAMGMVQQIFDQYQKTALPQIYTAQAGAGAYNSTGAQLLADDAYAQTVNKAASTVNQNVLNYSQAYQQQMNPLVQLLGIDKGSTKIGSDTTGFGSAAAQAGAATEKGQSNTQKGMGTLGTVAGTWFGGPAGGAIGGALGSVLGGMF